jgi:hypothetical protein
MTFIHKKLLEPYSDSANLLFSIENQPNTFQVIGGNEGNEWM